MGEGIFRIARDVPTVETQAVFSIGDFPISNSTLMILLITILLASVGYVATKRFQIVPTGFQNVVETIYEAILNLVDQITGDARRTKEVFPLVGALLIYIFLANFSGVIPGLTSITYDGVALFRAPTADFNTPFGLAIAVVLILQYVSIKEWGLLAHLGKYFKFKDVYLGFRSSIKDGLLAVIDFFIGLLDIVSDIAKVISLSLRLFGNMYAGEVLSLLILGALAYALPATYMAMSLLSATVQAVVFAALAAAYYMLSVKPTDLEPVSETKDEPATET